MTPSEIEIRALERPDDLAAVVALYESVFLLGPGDGSLNPRLLVGIARNGGLVLGAFSGGELVGFTLSFLARDARGATYQYSQLATVARDFQGRGIGRQLKFAQRDATLAMGLTEIRWSFDPFSIRNAHFNLDVLGARGVEVIRDLYGAHGHGLDAEHSTHRLIASWLLDTDAVAVAGRARSAGAPGDGELREVTIERPDGAAVALHVPAWVHGHDEVARESRESVVSALEGLFGEGLVAVSCRGDERGASYDFVPDPTREVGR